MLKKKKETVYNIQQERDCAWIPILLRRLGPSRWRVNRPDTIGLIYLIYSRDSNKKRGQLINGNRKTGSDNCPVSMNDPQFEKKKKTDCLLLVFFFRGVASNEMRKTIITDDEIQLLVCMFDPRQRPRHFLPRSTGTTSSYSSPFICRFIFFGVFFLCTAIQPSFLATPRDL